MDLIPWSGRFPGEENGTPLQDFAWEIPWREEPGGLRSTGPQRVGHDLVTKQQLQSYPAISFRSFLNIKKTKQNWESI